MGDGLVRRPTSIKAGYSAEIEQGRFGAVSIQAATVPFVLDVARIATSPVRRNAAF
jgi:hypothetical protein